MACAAFVFVVILLFILLHAQNMKFHEVNNYFSLFERPREAT